MNVIVFEDDQVLRLNPITTARPAFSITCGCLRLIDFLTSLENAIVVAEVRSYLQSITARDYPFLSDSLDGDEAHTLVVNARCVPCTVTFDAIQQRLTNHNADPLFDELGNLVIGCLPTNKLTANNSREINKSIAEHFSAFDTNLKSPTFCLPHDVIRFNQEYFNDNLDLLIKQNELSQTRDGLFVANGASVADQVAIDTTDGPVVIDAGAKVKPFAYLQGPVYVGPNCSVNEHASIKDFVCLTHTVKAGGEIEATIIEPYSNKQHYGFLGHSYLGSWINLGAGTCNSDLKNTYGKVSTIYGDEKVSTGMQFVGCFIGDYSKTAINATIYTGKSIGVCSMLYGMVPTNVPAFVNYARSFNQITEVPLDVMVTTQSRMFGRRKVEQRECDIQLLKDMFEITRGQRESRQVTAGQLNF